MPYTPLQVSIPKPCHESWDKMTPVGRHNRHCDNCAKQVTDFTWMTDREIDAVLRVAGNNVCGRFRPGQLNRPIRAVVLPATGWRAVTAAATLLLAGGTVDGVLHPPVTGELATLPTEQIDSTELPPPPPPPPLPPSFDEMLVGEAVFEDMPTPPPPPLPSIPEVAPVLGDITAAPAPNYRGRVVDEAGQPLIGSSIRISDTNRGTVSDVDGYFELSVDPGTEITISYVGYEPLKTTLLGDNPGFTEERTEHVLFTATTALEEVVVVGFTTVGKLSVVEAVSKVEMLCHKPTQSLQKPETNTTNFTADFTAYPNPFTDRINVRFRAENAGAMSTQLFDAGGRIARSWAPQPFTSGEARLEFPLGTTGLVAGTYILRMTDQRGRVESLVVIKR